MEVCTVRTRKSSSSERSKDGTKPTQSSSNQHHKNIINTNKKLQIGSKAPVLYYLSRSCQLEHPHYIEVPISSSKGLFLRDVIGRLSVMRGKRMASMYSWSCKRNYKNGFVWHDIAEDDMIVPINGNEFVLKGSEIFDHSPSDVSGCSLTFNGPTPPPLQHHQISQQPPQEEQEEECTQQCLNMNMSSSSHSSSTSETMITNNTTTTTANASTQTDPPPGSRRCSLPSKAETLEELIRAEPRHHPRVLRDTEGTTRAADVLIQLITCGSLPNSRLRKKAGMLGDMDGVVGRRRSMPRRRVWYSGSLVEVQRRINGGDQCGVALKRSSSHGGESGRRSPAAPIDDVKNCNLDRTTNLANVVISRSLKINQGKKSNKKKIIKGTMSPRVSSSTPIPKIDNCNTSKKGVLAPSLLSSNKEEEEEEKVFKIEERLTSGARVIIKSRPQSEKSEGSCSS